MNVFNFYHVDVRPSVTIISISNFCYKIFFSCKIISKILENIERISISEKKTLCLKINCLLFKLTFYTPIEIPIPQARLMVSSDLHK